MELKWKDINERIMEDAKGKKDFYSPANKLKVSEGVLTIPLKRTLKTVHQQDCIFTDHSLSQICNKLQIPTRYAQKCFEELNKSSSLDLFDENLNYWLSKSDQNFLLRTRDDDLRAVLSNRYSILDNTHIASSFKPEGVKFKDFHMDDHYFSLRGIFEDSTCNMKVAKNDPIFLGFSIVNSEVGLKRLTVSICIWRQVCSNGLIIQVDGMHIIDQRHFYVKIDQLQENFKIAMHSIKANGMEYLRKFKATVEEPVDDPATLIDSKFAELPQDFRQDVYDNLQGDNLYSLINTVTDRAKRLPIDQRIIAETIAGRLVA